MYSIINHSEEKLNPDAIDFNSQSFFSWPQDVAACYPDFSTWTECLEAEWEIRRLVHECGIEAKGAVIWSKEFSPTQACLSNPFPHNRIQLSKDWCSYNCQNRLFLCNAGYTSESSLDSYLRNFRQIMNTFFLPSDPKTGNWVSILARQLPLTKENTLSSSQRVTSVF